MPGATLLPYPDEQRIPADHLDPVCLCHSQVFANMALSSIAQRTLIYDRR